MSRSILVQGVYKNNRLNSVGLHEPSNNKELNYDELQVKVMEYLNAFEILKMKSFKIVGHVQGKKVIDVKTTTLTVDLMKVCVDLVNLDYEGLLTDIKVSMPRKGEIREYYPGCNDCKTCDLKGEC